MIEAIWVKFLSPMIKSAILLIIFVLVTPKESHAYIDPGIGGMVFQISGLIFFSFVAFWLGLWKKVKVLFSMLFSLVGRKRNGD